MEGKRLGSQGAEAALPPASHRSCAGPATAAAGRDKKKKKKKKEEEEEEDVSLDVAGGRSPRRSRTPRLRARLQ